MLARLLILPALALSAAALADDSRKLIVEMPNLQEAPPKTAAQPKDKVICRSDYAIGSLVKRNRWCATAAEWREADRAAKSTTDDLMRDKGRYNCNAGGCPIGTDVTIGGH